METNEIDEITCEYCGNTFSTIKTLNRHMTTTKYCKYFKTKIMAIEKQHKKDLAKKDNIISNLTNKLTTSTTNEHTILNNKINNLTEELKNAKEFTKIRAADLLNDKRKLQRECDILNNTIKERDTTIKELKDTITKNNTEIASLKDKLADQKLTYSNKLSYKDGQLSELSKKKGPTNKIKGNGNIIIQKLADLPIDNIHPMTIDYIRENIHKFTYDDFKNTEVGLSRFIIQDLATLINEDGKTEKNLACTDQAREKFYKLIFSNNPNSINMDGDKTWVIGCAQKLIKLILDELKDTTIEYRNKRIEELHEYMLVDKKYYDKITDEIYEFQSAFANKNGKNRDNLINNTIGRIKAELGV